MPISAVSRISLSVVKRGPNESVHRVASELGTTIPNQKRHCPRKGNNGSSHYYRHLGSRNSLINNGLERPGYPNYEKTAIRLVAHDTR
jgi:hypothetical protein